MYMAVGVWEFGCFYPFHLFHRANACGRRGYGWNKVILNLSQLFHLFPIRG